MTPIKKYLRKSKIIIKNNAIYAEKKISIVLLYNYKYYICNCNTIKIVNIILKNAF